ncbi:MAG: hypothetical protein IJ346_00855 [Clostridia bacterium]|nr:hypothetical protein [Clostridia bacterium]
MKKLLSIITALALIISLCVTFSGCDMIDDMREKHAIISEDKNAVVYKGKTFLRLPEGVPYFFNDAESNIINITDYDVPVLLSEDLCYTGHYDPLGDIIAVARLETLAPALSHNLSVFSYDTSVEYISNINYSYFTQKENYETYATLKAEDADRIGFFHSEKDFNTAMLSSSSSEEIFNLIEDTENWSEELFDKVSYNVTNSICPLYRCNKELTLRGTIDDLEFYLTDTDEAYLANYYTACAVKLSDQTAKEIVEKFYN